MSNNKILCSSPILLSQIIIIYYHYYYRLKLAKAGNKERQINIIYTGNDIPNMLATVTKRTNLAKDKAMLKLFELKYE